MDSARIVVDGNSQVILLPKDYWLKGSKVYLQKVGNSLLLIPEEDAWNLLFESLHQFSDDFLTERQQPNQQERNE